MSSDPNRAAIIPRTAGELLNVPAIIADAGEHAVEQYRAFIDQPKWSPSTREQYRRHVRQFFRWAESRSLTLESLTASHLTVYATEIGRSTSWQTARHSLTPVRGVIRHLVDTGALSNNPLAPAEDRLSEHLQILQALRVELWAELEERYRDDPSFPLVKSMERCLSAMMSAQESCPDAQPTVHQGASDG